MQEKKKKRKKERKTQIAAKMDPYQFKNPVYLLSVYQFTNLTKPDFSEVSGPDCIPVMNLHFHICILPECFNVYRKVFDFQKSHLVFKNNGERYTAKNYL